MRSLLWVLALIYTVPAFGQSMTARQQRYRFTTSAGSSKLLNQIALNATAADRTVTLQISGGGATNGGSGWSNVHWQVDATRAAYTALTMACTTSINSGTSYANMNSLAVVSGTGTLSTFTWIKPTSSSTNEGIDMDVSLFDTVKCVFGGTSAGATDLVDVYAVAGGAQ